ncbi:putative MO25-like protein At5g47540 [Benincasa hispida]|uniref:putative MO25-like protein At5g47540 n=1 Tax=Benincasa hispida TaxID=102211 RepID=UPI00190183B0|nr:putative MO25-like protein At5g47540 [Benincasa hispida]
MVDNEARQEVNASRVGSLDEHGYSMVPSLMSELNEIISQMRTVLYGNVEAEPSPDACSQLTQELFKENTFRLFIASIPKLNSGLDQCFPYLQLLQCASHVLAILQRQQEDGDIAITYGSFARECIRHQCVARYVLELEHMKFFDYIQHPIFYVALDASATFRVE